MGRGDPVHPGTANGYHGGITPQELIAPLVFLTAPGAEVAGLEEVALPAPEWWVSTRSRVSVEQRKTSTQSRGGAEETQRKTSTQSRGGAEETRREEATRGRGGPEVLARSLTEPEWLDDLFASEIYRTQLTLVRKYRPTEEEMRLLLTTLHERGGETTPAALAQRIGKPLSRFDGFLAVVSKILNVDSYEVLAHERERGLVRLSESLLKQQFQV